MAETEKPAKKKKKKRPHTIVTKRAEDGSFGHEHHYEGQAQPVFAGTSHSVDDLQQHMADHFGAEGGEGGGEEPDADEEAPAQE